MNNLNITSYFAYVGGIIMGLIMMILYAAGGMTDERYAFWGIFCLLSALINQNFSFK